MSPGLEKGRRGGKEGERERERERSGRGKNRGQLDLMTNMGESDRTVVSVPLTNGNL